DHVDGNVYITSNTILENLNGLQNLKTIGGTFYLQSNYALKNIEAINDLQSIGGDLYITSNDELAFCSVKSICRYLDNPSGIVSISSNATGCADEADVAKYCSPIVSVLTIDANLTLPENGGLNQDITQLPVNALLNLQAFPSAVAADGVSKVVLMIQFSKSGKMIFPDQS